MEKKAIFNKAKANLVIDMVLLLIMSAMLGIGLMIKYILITGEEKIIRYGSNFRQTIFGMDRHEWGTIHLYIGYAMVGFLLLHIVLHWKSIFTMFKNLIRNSTARVSAAVLLVIVSLMFVFIPFIMQPQVDLERKHMGRVEGNNRNVVTRNNDRSSEDASNTNRNNEGDGHGRRSYKSMDIDVKGYMSITDVCSEYNIPEKYLKKMLNIPVATNGNTRLRDLKEQYGIRMGKIKEIIVNKNSSLKNSTRNKQ